MGKNVAVFVDVANIFYAAKAAGVDIDYVTLLKASSAGRDLVRAYAYTGLDPDNENQRNFHDFLRRHGYKVVSKDIRKYGDGKVKANLDIELVVDMMKTARNLDIAIVVSGDGDFAPAIRAVQEQGVRVEVVSFRGNTSSDLMDVADQFTDITQIAKVEKGSSRSGRRVADDDADLSMTEVPDKQSEGAGDRTRGGRGRTRRTATTTAGTRGRSRTSVAVREPRDEGGEGRDASGAPLLVLPGEKLSRAARPAASDEDLDVEDFDAEGPEDADGEGFAEGAGDAGELGELGEDGRRRRRRRGGRGRGRGRRDGVAGEEGLVAAASERPSGEGVPSRRAENGDGEDDVDEAPRTRRTASTFGSVWDSQIGAPAPSSARRPIIEDEEDLDEPAIPEYLLTERRQRDGGRGRGGGGRGRGGAYAAALDRERYGGGRGSTPSRFAEPAPRREGGFGRPDRDRGGRPGQDRGGDRGRQGFRDVPRPAPRGSGDEPWSEVPPEIEAMLRAQMGSRADEPRRPAPSAPRVDEPELTADSALDEGGETEPPATVAPARRSRTSRTSAAAAAPATDGDVSDAEAPAPAAKATRSRTRKAAADAGTSSEEPATGTTRTRSARTGTSATRTTTRRTRTASAPSDDATPTEAVDAGTAGSGDAEAEATAPKRRTTRRKAEPAA